jgi:tetratricopeptide (TPR) repeat protein
MSDIETHMKQGLLLVEQGRVGEAVGHWQTVLALRPDHVQAHHNLGVAFAQLGQPDEAVRCLERALAGKPDYAEACFNLGLVLATQGKQDEAVARYREALRFKPDYADAYHNLGALLTEMGRAAEAAVFLRQGVRLRATRADTHNQLGLAFESQGRFAEAEACYDEALRLDPRCVDAHSNLGNAYQHQRRPDEALACYDLALWLQPDSASTHWNRALALLQQGDFARGWKEYEWRWQRKQTPARPFAQPRWDGSALDGRTILLYMEQGLGDMIMFIRYAALVAAKGVRKGVDFPSGPSLSISQPEPPRDPSCADFRQGTVIVECPGFLMPLLSRCPGIDQLVAEGAPLPHFDVQAPLMSLPNLLGTTLATIPANLPYLHADERLVAQWRERLAALEGFKIGIVWQGNPRHGFDRFRSIPLKQFALLARIPGVCLISLQRGKGTEQLAELGDCFPVVDLGDDLDLQAGAFMDSAAIMQSLDLVISVDTAAAHLAGGLGVPIWVLSHAIGEWRWLLGREDSPWYPNMRLFRQAKLGDWGPVFARMAAEIERRIAKTITPL